jgi:Protein of unknown function (DUF2778)
VPDACIQEKTRISRHLKGLVRVDIGLIIAVTSAVLAVGFSLTSPSIHAIGPGTADPQNETETNFVSAFVQADRASEPAADSVRCATFDERFYFDQQSDSFDERFASAFGSSGKTSGKAAVGVRDTNMLPPQLDKLVATQPTPTSLTTSRHASVREERLNTTEATMSVRLPLNSDSHTAVYDIAARTVYLPDGHRLEAHSGLGNHLDDPRYVGTKGQGPTPPNVYNLALRERLFHGVRAIRLVPVENGKMFGRDGILAHSYMLGPNGQSNGCVSFRNYSAFLNAYLKGEVSRLVVVEHLATTTGARAGSASGG